MKVTKLISIVLAAMMLLCSLVGCSADDGSTGNYLPLKDKVNDFVSKDDEEEEVFRGKIGSVAVSDNLIVGMKTDGTAAAIGGNSQVTSLDVSFWEDIIAVSAGSSHILGLRSDGTVVTAGYGGKGQRNVSQWSNIVAIHAGHQQSFGLRSNGTVVMTTESQSAVELDGWKNIVSIAGYGDHLWGLTANGDVYMRSKDEPVYSGVQSIHCNVNYALFIMKNGTVVADPYSQDYANYYAGIEKWTDIVDVATIVYNHAIGLKSDGTVVAVGQNKDGRGDVSGWTDIVAIATGSYHTVGLRSDGTVVATGGNGYGQCDVSEWKDIVSIYASDIVTVGLKADGTIVVAGQIWNGFDGIENFEDIKTK